MTMGIHCKRRLIPLLLVISSVGCDAFVAPGSCGRSRSSATVSRRQPQNGRARYRCIVCLRHSSSSGNNDADVSKSDEQDDAAATTTSNVPNTLSRTEFFQSLGIVSASISINPTPASAGLIQFPCTKLVNTYHLLRAGQSLLEEEDIWATNPLFLTNRECALSELGIEQVEAACRYLNDATTGVSPPTIVRYSLAANAIDAANIVGRDLRLGRDRLVPEFFFLDPRAVGLWDNLPISQAEPAVWAMDADEAGPDGTRGRPPANEDGTPAETLSDQVPRLRQLLSACESIYSGDTVLLVFPDGTGPALLSCLIGGIPLYRTHELDLKPGEVRCDVTYESVRAMLGEQPREEYLSIIAEGREKLKALRSQKDKVVNVKDQRYEQELLEEEARKAEVEKKRAAKEEVERLRRDEVNKRVEMDRRAKQYSGDAVDTTPIVAALVGAGALGVGSSFLNQGKDDETEAEEVFATGATNATDRAVTNATSAVESDQDMAIRNINGVPVSDATSFELDVAQEDISTQKSPSFVDADGTAQILSSTLAPPPAARSLFDDDVVASSADDRLERAEKAMQEYIDKDDGGEAWISMLSEMMDNKSEEEVETDELG